MQEKNAERSKTKYQMKKKYRTWSFYLPNEALFFMFFLAIVQKVKTIIV